MNEDRKKRGLANGKFFTAVAICALFLGSGNVMAAQTASDDSQGVQEQMQSISVTVTVVDTKGEPIIGANVIEKGTTNGGITDLDGVSKLNVKPGAILQVSFVGYTTQEVKATSVMKVVLKDDTELLDEVVVVGYGVQKKKLVTGATVEVKGEDIAKLNTTQALGALQSQSPGVNIQAVSGQPGDGFKINIRGAGTNGNTAPVCVIDGVAGGDINA
ncbi:TonB-dependent receptor plug domain-containing protein, partial [Bacteroides thetaiotaomicron]